MVSPMQILGDLRLINESKILDSKDQSRTLDVKEDSKAENQDVDSYPDSAKYQLQSQKAEVLSSKVLFFKNYFLNPVLVDLLELAPYFFVVRIGKYSLDQLEMTSRLFFVESLLGVVNRIAKSTYPQLIQHVTGLFKGIAWDEFIINALLIRDDAISFAADIKKFNYIRL